MLSQRWIKNYEGLYSCNRLGQIFRHWKNKKQTELKGYIAKGNKHIVKLIKDNQVKEFIVSRIIYETWIAPIPEGHIVIRRNKNLRDSHVDNLKLTTYKIHNVQTGAKAKSKPVELLDDNGKVIDSWPSARKAAKELFVSYQTVIDICNKKVKTKTVNVRWEKVRRDD